MAQHDYNIINGPGAAVLDDINKALFAIATSNSGPLPPTTALPGTLWFDISDTNGPGALKVLGIDAKWHKVASGAVYVPTAGGNVIGDLTVNGVFSNPDFNARRKNYIDAKPTSPLPGMLWYDKTVTPNTLKIYTADKVWLELVDVTSPTFTQMVTVESSVTDYAIVNLTASGENRRIYNHSGNDWLVFDHITPAGNGYNFIVADNGDWYVPNVGWMTGEFTKKQASLGFPTVQQYDGSVITIGYNPPQLWVDGASRGNIRLGSQAVFFTVGAVGSHSRCTSVDPTIAGNGLVGGGNLRIGLDSANLYGSGTWRNMGGRVADKQMTLFQRIS